MDMLVEILDSVCIDNSFLYAENCTNLVCLEKCLHLNLGSNNQQGMKSAYICEQINWIVFVLTTLFCRQKTAQTRCVFKNTFSIILGSLKIFVSILLLFVYGNWHLYDVFLSIPCYPLIVPASRPSYQRWPQALAISGCTKIHKPGFL